MSLERESLEQQIIEKLWDEQGRLMNSASNHAIRGVIAGGVACLATLAPGGAVGGVVIGLEAAHQLGAAAVDVIKHESNRKRV